MPNSQKVDKELMKKNNMKLLFNNIHRASQISKAQIAENIQMSIMSVNRITDDLNRMGLVIEQNSTVQSGVGRPPKILSVNSENLMSLGVDLQRDHFVIGLVDPYGKIIKSKRIPLTQKQFLPEVVLPFLAEKIKAFQEGLRGRKVLPLIGVAIPGIVDSEAGCVQFSSHFKWHDVPVKSILHQSLPEFDFIVENDIKVIAIAENRFGAAAGHRNSVILNIGEGIGAAVIINGDIYRGKDNLAGEIGHIIINPQGRLCECGQIGCLQTNIAEWAILREANSMVAGITLDRLFEEYDRGTAWVTNLIDSVVDYTAITINLLANTYSPEIILLCGSLIQQYPRFRELIRNNYRRHLNQYIKNIFELKYETFGEEARLMGSGIITFNQYLDRIFN